MINFSNHSEIDLDVKGELWDPPDVESPLKLTWLGGCMLLYSNGRTVASCLAGRRFNPPSRKCLLPPFKFGINFFFVTCRGRVDVSVGCWLLIWIYWSWNKVYILLLALPGRTLEELHPSPPHSCKPPKLKKIYISWSSHLRLTASNWQPMILAFFPQYFWVADYLCSLYLFVIYMIRTVLLLIMNRCDC